MRFNDCVTLMPQVSGYYSFTDESDLESNLPQQFTLRCVMNGNLEGWSGADHKELGRE